MHGTGTSVFLIDPHAIYRRGVVSCLEDLPSVAEVDGVDTPRDAWPHPALPHADVVIVDVPGADLVGTVARLASAPGRCVVAAASSWCHETVVDVIAAGARGVLSKHALT